MGWAFWIGFVFVAAIIVYVAGYIDHRLTQRAWSTFAARNNLTYQPTRYFGFVDSGQIRGFYRGRTVAVDSDHKPRLYRLSVVVHREGSRPTIARGLFSITRVSVVVTNPSNCSLDIREYGLLGGLQGDLGERVPNLSESFTRRFRVVSRPPNLAAELLSAPGLQRRLLEVGTGPSIVLKGQELRFEQTDLLTDLDYMQFILDLTSELARKVEGFGARS
jgi:hypothetical protein